MRKRKCSQPTERAKSRRRAKPATEDEAPPEPGTDKFAFRVAEYAWQEGLTANAIAKRIGLTSSPKDLMRVKRALKQAQDSFLKLIPPLAMHLQEQLHDRINVRDRRKHAVRFYVVDDRWGPESAAVAAVAASLASKLVFEAVRDADRAPRPHTRASHAQDEAKVPNVVICNAGGRTIAQMVRALLRTPRDYAVDEKTDVDKDTTLFLAGNAAYRPEEFDCSANFLSVTMAEFFGTRHLALPTVEDPGFPKNYDALADRASLFICGVGTPVTGLMGKYFQDRTWPIPQRAVGDLAFNFLDEHGESIDLPPDARPFMHQVNPALSLSRIAHIAANKRVLLIIDSKDPKSKATIGVAALRREYATHVVLGSQLAEAILARY